MCAGGQWAARAGPLIPVHPPPAVEWPTKNDHQKRRRGGFEHLLVEMKLPNLTRSIIRQAAIGGRVWEMKKKKTRKSTDREGKSKP